MWDTINKYPDILVYKDISEFKNDKIIKDYIKKLENDYFNKEL